MCCYWENTRINPAISTCHFANRMGCHGEKRTSSKRGDRGLYRISQEYNVSIHFRFPSDTTVTNEDRSFDWLETRNNHYNSNLRVVAMRRRAGQNKQRVQKKVCPEPSWAILSHPEALLSCPELSRSFLRCPALSCWFPRLPAMLPPRPSLSCPVPQLPSAVPCNPVLSRSILHIPVPVPALSWAFPCLPVPALSRTQPHSCARSRALLSCPVRDYIIRPSNQYTFLLSLSLPPRHTGRGPCSPVPPHSKAPGLSHTVSRPFAHRATRWAWLSTRPANILRRTFDRYVVYCI